MLAANQNTESDAPKFGRLFGDLRVRKKLIVLRNPFFLVLASAVYFPPPHSRVEVTLFRLTNLAHSRRAVREAN